ncbi:amino acid ABC transporter permease [Arthrobacter sp. H14-L1]|uniref:amino acid ABC transporter permease n=1 Tax=Arthrobacter sp. H14-L1 TaxID=2996697 RepID=UPI0022716DED|nr:amino acid ABC transporter permease [Arthrobacter sp. H14-L1]MCY0904421.1 amino acid ABC transporter permease [Arthrobacter sp. H14-L1]
MTTVTLFDKPGPRARKRHAVMEVLSLAVLGAAGFGVYRVLDSHGEFGAAAWQPFTQWGLWKLLAEGLGNNLRAAGVGMVLSLAFGALLAVGLLARRKAIRVPCRIIADVFASVPLLLLLYFTSLVLPSYGLKLSDFWFLVIALTLYSSAVIGDLLRSGILAIPNGQTEAAQALGFSGLRTMQLVLLPQALRSMSPALISQMVILFKGTALAYVLGGYLELLRSATVIGTYYSRSLLQAQIVAAVVFMIINIALGAVAVAIERRERRRQGTLPSPDQVPEVMAEVPAG